MSSFRTISPYLNNKNKYLFCIVFKLDKNLLLTRTNKLVFVSLIRFFALSLH